MSSRVFWRTVICGFLATFTMMMIAFIQAGLGLPTLDIGHFLKESFNHAHQVGPYSILWGNIAFYIIGILLALIWVVFLQRRIPGNWLIQGLIYGVIISVIAGLIVSPLLSLSAGEPFGLFYFNTWIPGLLILSGLIMHLGYGLILCLCLKYAGVNGID